MFTPGSGNPIVASEQFINVTPSDTAVLSYHGVNAKCRAISFGTAGTLAIKDDQGTSVTITGLAAGVMHPISTGQILSTGTTALNISAYF